MVIRQGVSSLPDAKKQNECKAAQPVRPENAIKNAGPQCSIASAQCKCPTCHAPPTLFSVIVHHPRVQTVNPSHPHGEERRFDNNEIRLLFARLTRWCAPLPEHLGQRPRPFLLTRGREFVHPRRRRRTSAPHRRLRRQKSSMLPDEVPIKGSSQLRRSQNRSITPKNGD